MTYLQKTFILDSGERYCVLIDSTNDLPLYYPNLYITTQVRNKSLSFSAMEATLNGISTLLKFFEQRNDNIEQRFRERRFLQECDLDAIRDFCQYKLRNCEIGKKSQHLVKLKKSYKKTDKVGSHTEYIRLTIVAQYLKWLAEQCIGPNPDRSITLQIEKMEKGLKARRPIKKKRNIHNNEKSLNKSQIETLFELLKTDAVNNPFNDPAVKSRNRLIFLMLYHLGLRGGELLNIRIRDIDFGKNQLIIARRADEKDDPRKDQPLVKTLDRRLPIKETLAKEIHRYILYDRSKVPNSVKHDFLLITHRCGPAQGQPLSKSGYKKVIETIQNCSESLLGLTGHQLRHTWNEAFSNQMDKMDKPPSQETQEKMRSYIMGWKEGSGTARHYNNRFIRKKANDSALILQKGALRKVQGISNEEE